MFRSLTAMQHQTWVRPTNTGSFSKKSKQKNRAATTAHPCLPSHQVKNQLVYLSCALSHTSGQKWLYYWYVKLQQLSWQHLSFNYLRKRQEGELQAKDNLWSQSIFIHLAGRESTYRSHFSFLNNFLPLPSSNLFFLKHKAMSDSSCAFVQHLSALAAVIKIKLLRRS